MGAGAGAKGERDLRAELHNTGAWEDNPIYRWQLCQALGQLPAMKEAFKRVAEKRQRHEAAAIGLLVGSFFTCGALAGPCAKEFSKMYACELNFLAFCAKKDQKANGRREGSGSCILDPKTIPDISLFNECRKLAREENMTAEWAYLKAYHDCYVVKIVAIVASLGADAVALGADIADLCFEIDGFADFCDTMGEIKGIKEDVEGIIESVRQVFDVSKDIKYNCTAFIERAMTIRTRRAKDKTGKKPVPEKLGGEGWKKTVLPAGERVKLCGDGLQDKWYAELGLKADMIGTINGVYIDGHHTQTYEVEWPVTNEGGTNIIIPMPWWKLSEAPCIVIEVDGKMIKCDVCHPGTSAPKARAKSKGKAKAKA